MTTMLASISYLLIFAILIALAWRDLKDYLLPDILTTSLMLVYLSFHIATDWLYLTPLNALVGAALGGGMLFAIRALASRFYEEDALGLGDVKLMAAAGFGLGHPDILLALMIGAAGGLLQGLYLAYAICREKGETPPLGEINVPAGLGLTFGCAAVTLHKFGLIWLGIS